MIDHSSGITLARGPVAHLLSAGAGLDVVGLRSWELPVDTRPGAVSAHPENLKQDFATAFAQEAARVPQGRTRFRPPLRRLRHRDPFRTLRPLT